MHVFSRVGLAVVLSGWAGIAAAADLPVKAPPPIPLYDWTGFYIGANAGYSWGRASTSNTFSITPSGLPSVPGPIASGNSSFNMDGAIAGGQLGYNWQINRAVLGVEADFQWSGQKGSTTFVCPVPAIGLFTSCNALVAAGFDGFPPTVAITQSLEWFGTLRGRAGALVSPETLVYVTGGLAYGQIKTDGIFTGYNVRTVMTSTFSQTNVQVGWTAGVGLEQRIAGNWTGKIEYLYMDLGTINGSAAEPRNFPPLALAYSSHVADNILRIGLNYKFGSSVVAKY
jgi:outer membrane immunogenic protein